MIVQCKSTDYPFIDKDENFRIYASEVRKHDLIDNPEDERRLLRDAQQTEDQPRRRAAINRLVLANQRFVISVAKKVAKSSNFLDLVNEGNIGLMEAIQRFDTSKKHHFITYAVWWIRKQINNYLYDRDMMVHPSNYPKIKMYSSAIQRDFMAQHQRYATAEELKELIWEKYKFNVPDLADLSCGKHVSIDEPVGDDDDSPFETYSSFNSVTSSNNVDVDIDNEHHRQYVMSLIETLPERNQLVVKAYYGVCGSEERTLSSISYELGLTEERVRQILEKSMAKLKLAKTKVQRKFAL